MTDRLGLDRQRIDQVLLRNELDVARLAPVLADRPGTHPGRQRRQRHFDSTAQFGLGRALDELRNDPWCWVRFEIVTAHRDGDAGADHVNFRFDTPPVALSNFDELWLFGVQSGPALPAAQIAAIRTFMDTGGGVFATGDHDELGAGLSGDLPRVNAMPRWRSGGPAGSPPPQFGPNRHDRRVREHRRLPVRQHPAAHQPEALLRPVRVHHLQPGADVRTRCCATERRPRPAARPRRCRCPEGWRRCASGMEAVVEVEQRSMTQCSKTLALPEKAGQRD